MLALSSYYTILVRHQGFHLSSHTPPVDEGRLERIYILPSASKRPSESDLEFVDAPVYAPVPLTQISPKVAEELLANATEAWISRFDPTQRPVRVPSLSLTRRPLVHSGSGAVQTADLISLGQNKA